MRLIATKDRNFDAIESSRFDLFQVRVVLFGHLGGPEQQIHANLHIVLAGFYSGDAADDAFRFYRVSRINSIKQDSKKFGDRRASIFTVLEEKHDVAAPM